MLAVGFESTALAQEPKKYGADGMPNGWVDNPLAFVSIAEDGTVTIVCHRSEMGQGVRTGMPMIVADELEADWKRVRVAQATGDEKKFGNQDTDGSRSTRHFFEPMRRRRRRRALDAGGRGRRSLESSGERGGRQESRGRPRRERPASGVWRAREGRRQSASSGPSRATSQGPERLPLHRQGRAEAGRCDGHRDGQSPVRHRHQAARHALRGRGASSGPGRQGRPASTTPRRSRCPGW